MLTADSVSYAQLLTLLRRERFREALRHLEGGRASVPTPADLLALRAEAHAGLAEFDDASRLAAQALVLDPESARALTVLGRLAADVQRNPQQAVVRFQQALAADASFAAAWYGLGVVLLHGGQPEEARSALERARALDPGDWRTAAALALLASPRQRYTELRQAYQAGLRERPGSLALRARLLGTYLLAPLAGLVAAPPATATVMRAGMDAYRQVLARRVFVTYLLIAINALMLVVLELNGGSDNNDTLFRFGAKENWAIVHGHEYWRLITPVFLHAGLLHLAVNSLSLYFVGTLYERCVGRARFLYVYFFAGIGGSLASVADSQTLGVGASGAIFGILGAVGVYFFRNRRLYGEVARKIAGQVVFMTVLNLVILRGIANVDNAAHLGGLIAGCVAALAAGPALRVPQTETPSTDSLLHDRRSRQRIVLALCIAAVVLFLVAVLILSWNPAGSLNDAGL